MLVRHGHQKITHVEVRRRGTLYNTSWRGSSACLDGGQATGEGCGVWDHTDTERRLDDINEWCQMDIHSLRWMESFNKEQIQILLILGLDLGIDIEIMKI